MKAVKMICLGILLLLVSSVFTQAVVSRPLQTMVVILPNESSSRAFDITVLGFNTTAPVQTQTRGAQTYYNNCNASLSVSLGYAPSPSQIYQCMVRQSVIDTNATRYGVNTSAIFSIRDATFQVLYYNVLTGSYVPVSSVYSGTGCDGQAAISRTGSLPSESGISSSFPYYFVHCEIPQAIMDQNQQSRLTLRVDFVPQNNQNFAVSSAYYELNTASVSASNQFASSLQSIFIVLTQTGSVSSPAGSVPCIGAFLILGLFLASLYFSGRSPLSLLDITTPRLPMPKGIAASGQIILPWGYTEFSHATAAQLKNTINLVNSGVSRLSITNVGTQNLVAQARSVPASAAHSYASVGSTAQMRDLQAGAITLGAHLGLTNAQLAPLSQKILWNWGVQEHKTMRDIIETARKSSNHQIRVLGLAYDSALADLRGIRTVEAIGGHSIGERSLVWHFTMKYVNMAVGAGRFAMAGGVGTSLTAVKRPVEILGRGMVSLTRNAPQMARNIATEGAGLVWGQQEVNKIRSRRMQERFSTAAAPTPGAKGHVLEGGVTTRVDGLLAKMAKTRMAESQRVIISYLMEQIYRGCKLNFNKMTLERVMQMGYLPVDVMSEINFGAAERLRLADAEGKMVKILSNKSISMAERLERMMRLAEEYNPHHIDAEARRLAHKISDLEARPEPEHVKFLLLKQALDEHRVVAKSNMASARAEDAFICAVGDEIPRDRLLQTYTFREMQRQFEKGMVSDEVVNGQLNGRLLPLFVGKFESELISTMSSTNPSMGNSILFPEFARGSGLEERERRMAEVMRAPFKAETARDFEQAFHKPLNDASAVEIAQFFYARGLETNPMANRNKNPSVHEAVDSDARMPHGKLHVDMHSLYSSDPGKREVILPFVQARFTDSNITVLDPSIEAMIKRTPGAASLTPEARNQLAKKLLVQEALVRSFENMLGSPMYAANAWGHGEETDRMVLARATNFLNQALKEKGYSPTQKERYFLEHIELGKAADQKRLVDLLLKYNKDWVAMMGKSISRERLATDDTVWAQDNEGGLYPVSKTNRANNPFSDYDRVSGGMPAIVDEYGHARHFKPDDVEVRIQGRPDLYQRYHELMNEPFDKDGIKFQYFMKDMMAWARSGSYDFDKENQLAAVLWRLEVYDRFWDKTAVVVSPRRETESDMHMLKMFGQETPTVLREKLLAIDNIGRNVGEWAVQGLMDAGGDVLRASYDVALTSEIARQKKWALANELTNSLTMSQLTQAQTAAAANILRTYYGWADTQQWMADRANSAGSTSPGLENVYSAYGHHGPGNVFPTDAYIGNYLDPYSRAMWYITHGWSTLIARKAMEGPVTAFRMFQESNQNYGMRFDQTSNIYQTHNGGQLGGSINSLSTILNPFSYQLSFFKKIPGLNMLPEIASWGGTRGLEARGGGAAQVSGHSSTTYLDKVNFMMFDSEGRRRNTNPGQVAIDREGTYWMNPRLASYAVRVNDAYLSNIPEVQEMAFSVAVRRQAQIQSKMIMMDRQFNQYNVLSGLIPGTVGSTNPQGRFLNPVAFVSETFGINEALPKWISEMRTGQSAGEGLLERLETRARNAPSEFNKSLPWNRDKLVSCAKCGAAIFKGIQTTCARCSYEARTG